MANIQNNFFEKHHKRLVLEAILKSALYGVAIGFGVNFLVSALIWFFDFGGIWLSIGIGIGAVAVSVVLLYFLKFRPTAQQIAHRVDRLGLEERMITMLELQEENSYIANLQRENAKEHLQGVSDRRLKLRVPLAIMLLAAFAVLGGAGMTTVAGLAGEGMLPSGNEIFNPEDPLAEYLAITYAAATGGEIEGETDQLLLPGEQTTPVVAIAEDGWVFVGWDDGGKEPERFETDIQNSITYTAIFEQIIEGDGESEESEEGEGGNSHEEGDKADDLPAGGEANTDSDQGGEGDKGNGSGSDANEDGGSGESEEQGEGKGDGKGQGAGGKWEDSNQFIDGNTYYRDYLEMYYELAQQIFEEGGEIPPELREFFETYFNGI